MTGPGLYQFGFEYSKDVNSAQGEDLIRIDNVALLDRDGVAQLNSALGPFGRQDFEGVFPPPGWAMTSSLSAPFWVAATNGTLTGAKGAVSAQSGPINNNEWTELRTPLLALSGSARFSLMLRENGLPRTGRSVPSARPRPLIGWERH